MPPHQKLKVLQEKHVLKQTFKRDLPPAIIERHKYPYRAPDALALYRGALKEELLESLSPESVGRRGLFHVEGVRKLMDRVHRSEDPSARDNMALVLVYSTHVFQDLFVDDEMRPAVLPPLTTSIDLSQTSNQVEYAL